MSHHNKYKLIGIDLSRQKKLSVPQQTNFAGKLQEDNGARMFFIAEKQEKTIQNFSLDSLNLTEKSKIWNKKMEHQKTLNLLNEANDSKFVKRKQNITNDKSNANYDEGNEIICSTIVSKSNLCITRMPTL